MAVDRTEVTLATPTTIRPTETKKPIPPKLTPTDPVGCLKPPIIREKAIISEGAILYSIQDDSPGLMKRSLNSLEPIPFLSTLPCCTYVGSDEMSSDRKWIVLFNTRTDGQGNYLIVTGQDDREPIIIDRDTLEAGSLIRWLNDHQLVFYNNSEDYPQGTLILYDPFTKERKVVTPAFPDLVHPLVYRPPGWSDASDVPVYDPTLTKVVYYSADQTGNHHAILYLDLETGDVLWSKEVRHSAAVLGVIKPQWSPDGSQFALFVLKYLRGTPFELTIVDRKGNDRVISDPLIPQPIASAGGLGWSPDGKYLSFYIQVEEEIRLLVLDTNTDEIWDTCIRQPYLSEQYPLYKTGSVTWSPSGRQFIVDGFGYPNPFSYLVDVDKKEIFDLDFGYFSISWLAE